MAESPKLRTHSQKQKAEPGVVGAKTDFVLSSLDPPPHYFGVSEKAFAGFWIYK